MDAIGNYVARYARGREEELSLDDYLAECKRNPLAYATAAERVLAAIGEPEILDTRSSPRLSRIFANKLIKIYPAFAEFYGMEDAIEQVVSYFRHAAQGLEERKQILYLLGPVGGGKSSLAERLKPLETELAAIDRRLPELERRLASIEADLADPQVYRDNARAVELSRERASLGRERELAETRWLELSEQADAIRTEEGAATA